ncbi:hypothetical protein HKCCE4037_14980 [Rhodobacterales bacterium HKCCE4037]|nr:hypothetical protein [Rhodobacterales bacterium HKCCE4037]
MKRIAAPLIALACTAPAMADTIPASGRCLAPGGFIFEQVAWTDNGAQMQTMGSTITAEMRGLRAHDTGFRLSIVADHPVVGHMEVPIFYLPGTEGPRMAAISYEETPEGPAASYVTGFETVNCTFN